MKLIPKRWYYLVALLMPVTGISLAVLLYLTTNLKDESPINLIPLFLIILALPWSSWACPALESRNPHLPESITPGQKLRFLLNIASLPFFATALFAIVFMAIRIYDELTSERPIDISAIINPAVVLAFALFLLAVITFPLRRSIKRQFKVAIVTLNLCFACGYNLTGAVSPTCPECGHPIPGREDKLHV